MDGLAARVERAILDIDMEGLGARGGRTIGGFVEPAEAAWELLDEALQPFLDDLKRSIELGLESQAVEQCKGIVLGLYRSDQKASTDQVLEWAPDFPLEGACEVVHLLERESRRPHGMADADRIPGPGGLATSLRAGRVREGRRDEVHAGSHRGRSLPAAVSSLVARACARISRAAKSRAMALAQRWPTG